MKRLLSMLMAGILCVGMLATMTGCGTKDNTPVVATIDGEDVASWQRTLSII